MKRSTPRSTLTDTRVPYTTLCRSRAVRGAARVDGGRAVALHHDPRVLAPRPGTGRHLDVDGHADAELHLLVRGATASLLGPEVLVAGGVKHEVARLLVVTDVVGYAHRRRGGAGVGRETVAASHPGGHETG